MKKLTQKVIKDIENIILKYSSNIYYEIKDNYLPPDINNEEHKKIKDIVLYSLSENDDSKIVKIEIELYNYLDKNKLFNVYVYPIFFDDVEKLFPEKLQTLKSYQTVIEVNKEKVFYYLNELDINRKVVFYDYDKIDKKEICNYSNTIDINYTIIPKNTNDIEITNNNFGLAA